MKDAATSSALMEHNGYYSNFAEVDFETGPKSTTGKQRVVSRNSAVRDAPRTNAQTIHKDNKKVDYGSSVYDTHLSTFVKENVPLPRTKTHRVKSNGRRRRDSPPLDDKNKGSLTDTELVAYFSERMSQLPLRYGFKSSERYNVLQKSMSVNYHKDNDLASGQYETSSQQSLNVPHKSTRHSFFKSKTQRKIFLPKLGPAPGDYEHQTNMEGPVITSSFRSGTNRFSKKPAKIPGPGTYDKVFGIPTPKQIDTYLSRGIYFRSVFT